VAVTGGVDLAAMAARKTMAIVRLVFELAP
jgi:hypothetical protein